MKCSLLATSRSVPREDITAHPERGPASAAAYLDGRWPGAWRFDRTATLEEGIHPTDESLWIGTWGDTVVLAGLPVLEIAPDAPAPDQWMLLVHSVVDQCSYRTPPAHGGRAVDLTAENPAEDKRAALTGDLLPFEEPYANGSHDDPEHGPDFRFHPLELGAAALVWMFGTIVESPPDDDVVRAIRTLDPWDLPFHRFVPAGALTASPPVYAASAPRPDPDVVRPSRRRGFFARLLGR